MSYKVIKAMKYRAYKDEKGNKVPHKDVPLLNNPKEFLLPDWKNIQNLKMPDDEIWIEVGSTGQSNDNTEQANKRQGRPKKSN